MKRGARRILVTGASSGIGRALALRYAQEGRSLALFGRDAARLEAVAAQCRAKGAETAVTIADVRDRRAMADRIAEADARDPLDLVIANAGVSTGLSPARSPRTRRRCAGRCRSMCSACSTRSSRP